MSAIALYDGDKTLDIYNKVKEYIPEELKEEFQYMPKGITRIPLPRDSEQYDFVINEAKKYSISIYSQYEFTLYTPLEKRNAKWFRMGVSYPLESAGKSSLDFGTKLKGCCQECNIGGIPQGDILVDRKYMKKKSIVSLVPGIIVSRQVKWLIEENCLTGVNFDHKVSDFKNREIEEYYCMTFDNILPPTDIRTWLSYNPPAVTCKKCGREVPYIRSNWYYKIHDFDNAQDFNLTYEFTNNWAERDMIVSRKVKDIFQKYKIGVGFEMLNIL